LHLDHLSHLHFDLNLTKAKTNQPCQPKPRPSMASAAAVSAEPPAERERREQYTNRISAIVPQFRIVVFVEETELGSAGSAKSGSVVPFHLYFQ
jgi:hypothetical protein